MSSKQAIVVGSGPSGYITSVFLLRHGWEVRLLDFGKLGEGMERFRLPENLANDNRESLVNIDDFSWKDRKQGGESLNPARMRGRYFYAETDERVVADTEDAVANVSLAFGGLSNLWGANVLAADKDDIDQWPVTAGELKPYYEQVSDLVPLSADRRDALSRRFDFPFGAGPGSHLGPQARQFAEYLEPSRATLEDQGVYFGLAKLAIDPRREIDPRRDPYPFGPIFHSGIALQTLVGNPKFHYTPDVFVERIEEDSAGKVTALGEDVRAGTGVSFSANKLFVACGVLGTAQLLSRSLDLEGETITIRSNQNAFFPFLRFQRTKGVSRLPDNTISQLFIDIKNEHTRNRFAHIEVHQYGQYALDPVKSILGPVLPLACWLGRFALERLMIFQGFLHSDFSDSLEARFSRNNGWRASILGVRNPEMHNSYRNLLRFLAGNRRFFGGLPVKPVMLIDPPGASNHLGGSFPMGGKSRNKLFSDEIGRPPNLRNVHLVDASVLPSLPATTLTFTMMANAARITERAVLGDCNE